MNTETGGHIYILKECNCASEVLTEVNLFPELLKHTEEGAMHKNLEAGKYVFG